jgi:hypothetical protein
MADASKEADTFREQPLRRKIQEPTLGPGDDIGEGDTFLVLNLLSPELEAEAMDRLRREVKWNVMMHRGLLAPLSLDCLVIEDANRW